jgi:hypothetical protein
MSSKGWGIWSADVGVSPIMAPVSKPVSKKGFSLRLRNKRFNGLMLEAFSIY